MSPKAKAKGLVTCKQWLVNGRKMVGKVQGVLGSLSLVRHYMQEERIPVGEAEIAYISEVVNQIKEKFWDLT